MSKVTVISLVYKSTKYLEAMLKSLKENTPEALYEILIVANDATPEVKQYLVDNNIPHIIHENEKKDEYYLNRVYKAYNAGIRAAKTDIIIMTNTDIFYSENWLQNLLKHLTLTNIITSRLVESGKMPSGMYGVTKNFGRSPNEFDNESFQKFAEDLKIDVLKPWGMFTPIAYYKNTFLSVGGYPHGNIKLELGPQTVEIPGDIIIFTILATKEVRLYTAFDSVCYHIQEGEKDGL